MDFEDLVLFKIKNFYLQLLTSKSSESLVNCKCFRLKVDCKSSDVNYEVYTQRQLATDKR